MSSRKKNKNTNNNIIKVTFEFDTHKKYSFDVNKNINIHSLIRMLYAASNIGRKCIRIFNDNTEYTKADDLLMNLFPNENQITFETKIDDEKCYELNINYVNLDFGYCDIHKGKYTLFYCYNCQKSFCSDCLKTNLHKDHNYSEKYDYLQDSKILIERIFNNIGPQISSNGNPIILANTHLPRSYYDDIIDNLELVSLNMINDLKVLIKNQKNVKVSQFDTTEFINLKDAVKEQFMDVKDFRESQKNKLIDEFSKTKKSIKKFLEEKFQPGQALLGKFAEDLKRDKQKFNDNINSCEDSLNEESDNIRKLLLSSTDWYVKVASQKVYQPHDPSDLENALKLKKLWNR
jgi:hypothetical protein